MKTCGIYGIRNVANGKWYIGQSVNISARRIYHFSLFRQGTHRNSHLQSAFKKYGAKSFEFHILEKTTEAMLDIRECAWIDSFRSDNQLFGYNLRTGGKSNHHSSERTRLKISRALTGRRRPKDVCLKISKGKTGVLSSEEAKKNTSMGHKGQVPWNKGLSWPKEIIKKISVSKTGVPWSQARRDSENNKRAKL